MQAKRRWFQFKLRSLVVLILMLSLVLGYWGNARRRAQRQWDAVQAIREVGGRVNINSGSKVDPFREDSLTSELPTWQKWIGIACPPPIGASVPRHPGIGKEIMLHLRQLPQLNDISLSGDWIDDESMEVLSGLPNLDGLYIESNQISDVGALSLAKTKHLKDLILVGDQLTDRGMAVVAQLPELSFLRWVSPRSTGEGFVHLRNHPRLSAMTISGNLASDVGFEHLSSCAKLEQIAIDGPNTLTSRGIGALSRLKLKQLIFMRSPLSNDAVAAISDLSLEMLWLTGPLSVEDLAHLSSLVSLRELSLDDCNLTSEGLKKLVPLKQLFRLSVRMAGLGDEDMEILAMFPNLEGINLANSAVTDVGLMKLAGMKQLRMVEFKGTKISAVGKSDFRKVAPKVMLVGP